MGKLSKEEYDLLEETLLGSFNTLVDFELLVKKLGRYPSDFAPTAGISYRIDALISTLEAQGQIEKLLDAPLQLTNWKNYVALRQALDQVRQSYQSRQGTPLANLPDPFDACLLDQGRPFIDRRQFRIYLKDINSEGGKRYMVVNGPSGSGKTYSHYMIQALASHCRFKFSFIELKQEIVPRYYPDIMARRINRDLTLTNTDKDPIPDQQAVGDRWGKELCDWLVGKILTDNSCCWIVLDGFSAPDLPDETRILVDSLIYAVDQRLPKVRLVLLDYKKEKLTRKQRLVTHEDILQEVAQPELEAFIAQLFQYKGIRVDDPNIIQGFASKLLENLPEKAEERMEEIMARIMETILPKLSGE